MSVRVCDDLDKGIEDHFVAKSDGSPRMNRSSVDLESGNTRRSCDLKGTFEMFEKSSDSKFIPNTLSFIR